MARVLIGYLASLAAFIAMDFCWLTATNAALYRPVIGPLLSGTVDMAAAVAFYLLYLAGLSIFAVTPALKAGGWRKAARAGALLGLVAYGTYDLTNQATLRLWSVRITIADMGWGMFVSAVASAAGYLAARLAGPKREFAR